MSRNTIIGVILIVILFVWSIHNANKQQELAQAELQRKATELAAEKAKQDSVKAARAENAPLDAPKFELPATPTATEQVLQDSPFAAQDVAEAAKIQVDSIESVQTSPKEIRVETDRFWVTLSSIGAKIVSVVPKALADSLGNFPELLQNREAGALSISFDNADFSSVLFSIESGTDVVVKDSARLVFEWRDEKGRAVFREYRFTNDGHSVRHVTRIKGFAPKLYTLNWKGGMRETEYIPVSSSFGMSYLFSEVILNNTYNVNRETITKQTWFNRDQGKALWFGQRRKYIAAIINFDGESEASLGAEPIKEKRNEKDPGTYALTISDNMSTDS
ncbi:MAG: YidC/Oxa1 family insertase periplasmic-domain containing protein, partial [Fibromonadales bacterium]|nr:YidC/Oxa1 family insertase periplasmic-domain containing protein [Fibromonadales bacterium]